MKPVSEKVQYHNTKAAEAWITYLNGVMPQLRAWADATTILTPVWFSLENRSIREIICVSCGGDIELRDFKYCGNDPHQVRCLPCTQSK